MTDLGHRLRLGGIVKTEQGQTAFGQLLWRGVMVKVSLGLIRAGGRKLGLGGRRLRKLLLGSSD